MDFLDKLLRRICGVGLLGLGASGCYNIFNGGLLAGQYSLVADSTHCVLMNSTHAFAATNTVWSNISGNEMAGAGGYLTGGVLLATLAIVNSGTSRWDAADVAWTASTFSAAHCVLYDSTTGSSLIASIDFGGQKEVSAGTFTLSWNGTGIVTIA
jgi:hypothetical protein